MWLLTRKGGGLEIALGMSVSGACCIIVMRILLSKRRMQKLGSGRYETCRRSGVSLILLCDSLAFEAKMLKAGIANIKDYSKTKTAKIFLGTFGISVHPNTIGKYVRTLISVRQAYMDGSNLVFRRIKSGTRSRNHEIDAEDNIGIKDLGREIAAYIFSSSMRSIGYISDTISKRNNPKSLKELKSARRRMRRTGEDTANFSDNGISYDTLCERFAISRPTASSLIKLCESLNIFKKKNNTESVFIENAKRTIGDIHKFISSIIEEITYWYYSSKEDVLRLYKVKANTYEYNPSNLASLSFYEKM